MTSSNRHSALLTLIAAQLEIRFAEQTCKLYVLASESQVSANTIRRLRQGKDHRVSTLIDVADSLGCDVEIVIKPRVA